MVGKLCEFGGLEVSPNVIWERLEYRVQMLYKKKKISKLRGKRKMRYENPHFPTTSDFGFGVIIQ